MIYYVKRAVIQLVNNEIKQMRICLCVCVFIFVCVRVIVLWRLKCVIPVKKKNKPI